MTRRILAVFIGLAALLPTAATAALPDVALSLRGSRESMIRQNTIGRDLDLTFHRSRADIASAAMRGELVYVGGNDDVHVIASHPYTLPETAQFVERLGGEYRAACDEPLVVTSLVRPSTRQPANASPLSVHPAGMALDLRVSARAECVDWLADRLLELEGDGLIDATREFRPPHFHVAIFPAEYARYEAAIAADSVAAVAALEQQLAMTADSIVAAEDSADVTQRRPLVVRVLRGVARLLGLRQA
jgi:hypothetical protein